MPKVSAIILTHNRPVLLRKAIESILNQSFQDFELLVVDDASTDNTEEIVRSYQSRGVRYLRNARNLREAGSRNVGVRNTSGEYIAFLDDDDEWLPKKLELQVALLENSPSKLGGVYTGFIRVDPFSGKEFNRFVPSKRGYIYKEMAAFNWVETPSTVLVRRACFETVGLFDESIVYAPDYDMWIRIAKEFHFDYIEQPLIKYSVHSTKMSTNYEIMIRGNNALIEKHRELFELDPRALAERHLYLGVWHCFQGELTKGRNAFLRAIRINPLDTRHYYNLILSVFGHEAYRKLKAVRAKI